jgi:hypothetical protein
MNMQRKYPYRWVSARTIGGLVLVLAILFLTLSGVIGCGRNSRDSGSTVTGRSTMYPGGTVAPLIKVHITSPTKSYIRVTDMNGTFTVGDVPTGTYTVTFARFGIQLYSETVVIDQGGQTHVVNMPALQTGWTDIPGNIRDFIGPVNGAEVWLFYENKGIAFTTTDTSGDFTFDLLPDGETEVVVRARNHELEVLDNVRIGFEGILRLDVEINPITPLEGGIIHGLVMTPEGNPIVNAFVGLYPNNVAPTILVIPTFEAITTDQGFRFTDVPADTYQIVAIYSEYLLNSELVIVEGVNEYEVNITLGTQR